MVVGNAINAKTTTLKVERHASDVRRPSQLRTMMVSLSIC